MGRGFPHKNLDAKHLYIWMLFLTLRMKDEGENALKEKQVGFIVIVVVALIVSGFIGYFVRPAGEVKEAYVCPYDDDEFTTLADFRIHLEEHMGDEVEPIRVGVAAPLDTIYGKCTIRGVELAVEEINEKGGILGRPLEIVGPEDTRMDPSEGRKVMELLLDANVDLIVHGMLDDVDAATMPLVATTDTIIFSTFTTTIEISKLLEESYQEYKNYFMPGGNDFAIARSVVNFAEFALEEMGWDSVVLLREDLVWTVGVKEYIEDEFPKLGIEIKDDIVVPLDATDFGPIFHMCEGSGADAILTLLAAISTIPCSQYASLEVDMPMYGVNPDAAKYEFWADTGGCEGVIVQYARWSGKQSAKMSEFIDRWGEKYTTEPLKPIWTGTESYLSLILYKQAVERAGTFEEDAVIRELEDTYAPWFTVIGGFPGPDDLISPGTYAIHTWCELLPGGEFYPAYSTVRWAQWRAPEEEGDYGELVCIWPRDYAVGEYVPPPWIQ